MAQGAQEPATVDDFLKTIVRSGLMTQAELQAVLLTIPTEHQKDPQLLARQLIRIGKLSWFQANKLLKGAASGLLMSPFEVVAPIGKGGMGMVYLARDRRTDKLLALKVLPPHKAKSSERMLARFRREMDISKRVSDPHIARTYDTGEYRGVYYIAMEFIPGETLHKAVTTRGPLTVPFAAKIFSEVASGLAHAHERGLIHRDLKPSNIMVTPNGHGKVLDLGLALIEGNVDAPREIIGGQGYVVGSMDYIAPEQTKDAVNVDGRADIYGIGCALFFALTGQPPFPGGSAKDKILRHRNERPPDLRKIQPGIPEEFATIVHRMMAKRPGDRYPSARAVRDILAKWAGDEPSMPFDRQTDGTYEQAIRHLQQGSITTEIEDDSILFGGKSSANLPWPSLISELAPVSGKGNRAYFWVCVGIVGFWVLVLLIMAIVLMMR